MSESERAEPCSEVECENVCDDTFVKTGVCGVLKEKKKSCCWHFENLCSVLSLNVSLIIMPRNLFKVSFSTVSLWT